MTDPKEKICETCRFSVMIDSGYRECRLEPPQPVVLQGGLFGKERVHWEPPVLPFNFWCGCWDGKDD